MLIGSTKRTNHFAIKFYIPIASHILEGTIVLVIEVVIATTC